MTKDEFVDQFIRKSGLPRHARTVDGVKLGAFQRIAIACPGIAAYGPNHYHLGRPCLGWELIEPPNSPRYRGGEYSVTDHRRSDR
jgi:hypothetical protein